MLMYVAQKRRLVSGSLSMCKSQLRLLAVGHQSSGATSGNWRDRLRHYEERAAAYSLALDWMQKIATATAVGATSAGARAASTGAASTGAGSLEGYA